jgi:hypothetical protein
MNSRTHRLIRRLSLAMALWPWLALSFGIFCALYTRASLGHWPIVYRDDSSDRLVLASIYPLCLAIFSTIAVVPLSLVLLVARRAAQIRPAFDKWAGAALAGSLAFYVVVFADPFGYIGWLLD